MSHYYDESTDDLDPFENDRLEIKREYRAGSSTVGREDLPYLCGNCRRRNSHTPQRCSACARWKERKGSERPETRWRNQDGDAPTQEQQ